MALLESDPVDWALDPVSGDLIMPIRYTRGRDAVAQAIRFRLSLIRGECFLNLASGVPYLDGNGVDPTIVILGRRFDRALAEAPIRAAILSAPGVGSITSLAISFDSRTRALSVSATVSTSFGDTVDVLASVPLGAS